MIRQSVNEAVAAINAMMNSNAGFKIDNDPNVEKIRASLSRVLFLDELLACAFFDIRQVALKKDDEELQAIFKKYGLSLEASANFQQAYDRIQESIKPKAEEKND
jgi:hypothetical protein